MMNSACLPEDVLIRRGLDALFAELGTVEAVRFLNLVHSQSTDSVEWHRRWQQSLDPVAFFDAVFRQQPADESSKLSAAATLDELLARMTGDNLMGEIDTGPALGAEAW